MRALPLALILTLLVVPYGAPTTSPVEEFILEQRQRARAGDAAPRPPPPVPPAQPASMCEGLSGLVVRREMGELGVSSFQQVLALYVTDMLGPSFRYHDDWPKQAKLFRQDRMLPDEAEAKELRRSCKVKVDLRPSEQSGLELEPFPAASGWDRQILHKICGPAVREKVAAKAGASSGSCDVLVYIQGHWQVRLRTNLHFSLVEGSLPFVSHTRRERKAGA